MSRVTGWETTADAVTRRVVDDLGNDVLAVWVHGSAALGGWTASSDLDVLVVVRDGATTNWSALGSALVGVSDSGPPLELSVIGADLARRPRPSWPFLLHVAGAERRWGPDPGHGDPDLALHLWVCHAAGISLFGPAPTRLIGEQNRADLLGYMGDELVWAVNSADARYAVLNACRAVAYAAEGLVLSKVDGGRWWLAREPGDDVVVTALGAQLRGSDLGRTDEAALRFVEQARALLV